MLDRMVNYTVADVLNSQLPDFNKRNGPNQKKAQMTPDIQVTRYLKYYNIYFFRKE